MARPLPKKLSVSLILLVELTLHWPSVKLSRRTGNKGDGANRRRTNHFGVRGRSARIFDRTRKAS